MRGRQGVGQVSPGFAVSSLYPIWGCEEQKLGSFQDEKTTFLKLFYLKPDS